MAEKGRASGKGGKGAWVWQNDKVGEKRTAKGVESQKGRASKNLEN